MDGAVRTSGRVVWGIHLIDAVDTVEVERD